MTTTRRKPKVRQRLAVSTLRWLVRHSWPNASAQGLTLVHFSAQRKRFVWDGGCMYE
jgi:hypothetical protein